MTVELRPCTRDEARAFVARYHRHHGVPVGWLWLHGAQDDDGDLCGVAVCGRPVARELDDGLTMEVTRMCTVGEFNTDSMLYAAAERAAKAKGYRRWLTYLLASEWDRFNAEGKRIGGAGARAVGWQELWRVKGRSWDCTSRPRIDKHPTEDKVAVGSGAWGCLSKIEEAA
jgi:hypothetical protein